MAAITIPHGNPSYMDVDIAEDGDLTIRVVEYDKYVMREEGKEPVVSKITDIKVSREVIAQNSSFLGKMLRSPYSREAEQHTVKLEGDSSNSLQIWFRAFHNKITDETFTVPLEEMWHLVAARDKYDFGIMKLKKWFSDWYHHQDAENLEERQREPLYPCWVFDHAEGFRRATKHLAYDFVGHITESNPTEHYELHLPARIIQQMNAAKGRLRNILERDFSNIAGPLLERDGCACVDKTFRGFYKALRTIEVWPFGVVTRRDGTDTILQKLQAFSYEAGKDACLSCRRNYTLLVRNALYRAEGYFDGLCLDCLNESKSKTRDRDTDYWRHDEDIQRDQNRRFSHGQSIWYFSFMGRWEKKTIQ